MATANSTIQPEKLHRLEMNLTRIFAKLTVLQDGLRGVGYSLADMGHTTQDQYMGFAVVSMADSLQTLVNEMNGHVIDSGNPGGRA